MRKKLLVRPSLCVNCRICEMSCSFAKTMMFNPSKARIWIHRNHEGIDIPMVCRHCNYPPCGKACPVGAIARDSENGIVRISPENCIGCYECIEACLFGAIRVDPEGEQVFKCDLCGGDPECVKWCPTGAIKYVDVSVMGTLSAMDKV
jgi:Fe-S-cluster-containing hydrogenase component 2